MALVDTFIVLTIVIFLILLTWSKVMDQSMLDTVKEIFEIFGTIFGGNK